MKLSSLFVISHALVALLSIAAVRLTADGALAITAAVSFGAVIVATWACSRKIQRGLGYIESIVADNDNATSLRCGLKEIDQTSLRIGRCAQRWESVAANTRRQNSEINEMMSLLNRRDANGITTSEQLQGVLSALGNSLREHVSMIESGANEIDTHAKTIMDGTEDQGHAVVKASAYVEQLAITIDEASSNAIGAHADVKETSAAATEALTTLVDLTKGLGQARADSSSCERKLRSLCDPAQQIASIVATINDITARTDHLALNASIESIRAGEHGRRFAVVADEVRRLTEQTNDATREIAGLTDAIKLVINESIRGIQLEGERIDSEAARASVAETALQQICELVEQSSRQLEQVTQSSAKQIQFAQDIVQTVQQIAAVAKSNRTGAEGVCWTMKSIAKTPPQVIATIDRLRNCGQIDRDDPIETGPDDSASAHTSHDEQHQDAFMSPSTAHPVSTVPSSCEVS
jgi:methyl-accepting chemotaxis protein